MNPGAPNDPKGPRSASSREELPSGAKVPVAKPGLQYLEGQASRFGGKTLSDLPYDINATKPAMGAAKEIYFNGTPAVEAGGLTAQELQYILSRPDLIAKTVFVFGSPVY